MSSGGGCAGKKSRGRVGRGAAASACVLLYSTGDGPRLGETARARLKAMAETNDGFEIARRDLDIRGAGNLLGGEQSGFINDLGFETYHKILDDAIQELKENEFRDLFAVELAEKAKIIVQDCVIETDLEILIPETYVNNTSERLQLYARLDNIKDEVQLKKFSEELNDRFGEIPPAVHEMINSVRLRWLGEELGFEKISLKNERVRGYFVTGNDAYFNSEVFGKILKFAQNNPRRCKIKDQGGKPLIVIENVPSVDAAIELFDHMIGRLSKSDNEIVSK